MCSVEDAQSRLERAQAALAKAKADVETAEKAMEEAKKSQSSKKRKATDDVDISALEKKVKKARKAMKADKNKDTKAALKAAKAELEKAQAAMKDTESSSEEEEEEEEAEKEVEKEAPVEEEADEEPVKKGGASTGPTAVANPNNCEKVFLGNLSWSVTDEVIKEFFKDCGEIVDVHWLEDRDTGKFKGCGFCTFDSAEGAAKAVGMNGQDVMGRDIKVDFSLPKPGRDGKKNNGASKFGNKPLSAKPEGCTTVFAGNLSFDIDDDQMRSFAEECGEIKQIRWLTNRDTGDFKGCGFIQFFDTEAVDKFVKKNGTELLGRPIRLDYSESKKQ